MSAADDANSYMDESIRELAWAYVQGGLKIALNPDNLAKYYTLGMYDNSALDAVESNYAAIGAYIHQLDTSLRDRVLNDPNYSLARWQSFAQDVSSDITSQTGFAWDSSYLANAPSSAKMAVQATADTITNPFQWPWYVWVAAIGGGLYLASPALKLLTEMIRSRKSQPSAA